MADVHTVQAAGVQLSLPPGWWRLPLAPEGREAALADLVNRQRPDLPDERRAQLAAGLAPIADAAWRDGAVFAAQAVMIDGGDHLVLASVLVTPVVVYVPAEALEDQAAAMARRGFPGAADPRPIECSVVTLPRAGRAIRIRSDSRSRGSDSPAVAFESLRLQFFIPVPGTALTTDLTFGAPVLTDREAHDDLVELFDAMAETFSFVDERGEQLGPAA